MAERSINDALFELFFPASRSPHDRRGMLFGTPPRIDDPYYYGRMRHSLSPDDPLHGVLAPLEHKEFAREAVRDNPLMAAPLP
mgnify:FL=1